MILLLNIHYQWGVEDKIYFYGKQGLLKDNGDLITQYNSEDDKKYYVWWLMRS
jgi:hypothetical protein